MTRPRGPTATSHSRNGPASTAATSRGSSARWCRGSTPTAGERWKWPRSAAAWAPSTRPTSRSGGPLFPLALCFSGNYDPSSWNAWGERGPAAFANNPVDYVGHLAGGHLDWLRGRLSLLLVCGQGQWEDTTGALASTRQFAGRLDAQGIRHELDLWGTDVPHGWPSWRAQVARHMPRFC